MSFPLLLYRREAGRLQYGVSDRSNYLTVLFSLGASGDPLRIGLKPGKSLRPVIERLPFEHVVEILVRRPDRHGPETGLLYAVLFRKRQGERVEPLDQVRQTRGNAVVDAKFVEHVISSLGLWSLRKFKGAGLRPRPPHRATPRHESEVRPAGCRAANRCGRCPLARSRRASTPLSRPH